mgnify:CR=1 FL=1
MISFRLSPEIEQLQARARRFAREVIAPVAAEYDRRGEHPAFVIERAGAQIHKRRVKSYLQAGISDEHCRLPASFHIHIFERILAEIDFRVELMFDYVRLILRQKMIRNMHLNLADNILHV